MLRFRPSYTPHWYPESDMSDITNTEETREYAVAGMTCSHCAASVREEVSELQTVSTVVVASGRLTVTGAGIDDDAVRAAVAEAGYQVV
jgi:copper chaperone